MLALEIPEGYEIYENVNAQVFLRKIQPKIILDQEIAMVESELKRQKPPDHFKVDTKKNIITIYQVNQDWEGLAFLLPAGSALLKRREEMIRQMATYSPMMRFVLVDEENRLFEPERYCFLGSIDDWIMIGGPDLLKNLVLKFVKHLGEDSFFELI